MNALPNPATFYFDEKLQSLVIKETDEWIVSVTPMLFNDRILLTHKSEYPNFATAGWCYDRGNSAILAAAAWNPDEQVRPLGFKKEAFDARG